MGSPIEISQMTSSLVGMSALLADPPRTVHPSATMCAPVPEANCLTDDDGDFDNEETARANQRYNRNCLTDHWEVEGTADDFDNAETVRMNMLFNAVLVVPDEEEMPDEDERPSGDRSTVVEDSDEPETPARLPTPFVDIRYNPEKKSWADLDDEDDEAWAGMNATPLDFLRHNTDKTLADLDEEHGGSSAAAVVTPGEKPAPRTAQFKYRGYCPRIQSWVIPYLDTIWEEEDEGPVDVRYFPPESRWVFNRTSRV